MESRKEKAFPRGGKKAALKLNSHSDFSLFRKPNFKAKKKKIQSKELSVKNVKPKASKKSKSSIEVKVVEELRPSIVQDGMLVLGIVSKVTKKIVIVSLPGRIRGAIDLANVSEFYRNIVENEDSLDEVPTLTEIFQVGDVLPVKVLAVSESHPVLEVTSDPKVINQKLSYGLLEEGFVLVGSVKSKEDHGFVIDFGIEQVNAFLNFTKVEPNKNLNIGQLLRCCIIKCHKSPGSCNIQLSVLKKDLYSAVIKKDSLLPLYCYVPGFQFQATVKKVLLDGVEVSYGKDNSKGFIHEDQLVKKFSNLTNDDVGSEVVATLLYVKPLVNFLFFKIFPKKPTEWPFEYGEIVKGKVLKAKRSGVFFKVSQGEKKAKCFVPVTKLKNANLLIENKADVINLYPANKLVHQIRLGDRNVMGRYYMGATDKASVEEKYYSVSDLKSGEKVTCTILEFKEPKTTVQIGKTIIGTVFFSDMTDVPMKNPTSKFKVGQKVKARVMDVVSEPRFLRLTMKPALLKEKDILTDASDYEKDKTYMGTIFKVLKNKLLVRFFNHVMGVVPQYLTFFPDCASLRENYKEGELVRCSVVDVDPQGQLNLSLILNTSNCQIEVGKKYNVNVVNKTKTGLFVDVDLNKNTKCKGFLPLELLTLHSSLASAFLSTYSVGDNFSAYCVIRNGVRQPPILGAVDVFEKFYDEKLERDSLEPALHGVLPFLVNFKNSKSKQLFLKSLSPGMDSDTRIRILKSDPGAFDALSKYQLVYGKVLNVLDKKITVSIKLRDVWNKNFDDSLGFLDSYITSLNTVILRQKDTLKAYSDNLKLGQMVKGTVEEVRSKHAIVRTESGDLGLVEGKFKQGENIIGKVVWVDVQEQLIYIRPKTSSVEEIIASDARSIKGNNFRGKIVFIDNETVVIELKGRGNDELAFMPRRRHLNDMSISELGFSVGEEIKVSVIRKNFNNLLAMDSKVVSYMKKIENKNLLARERKKLEMKERKENEKTESREGEVEVISEKLSVQYDKTNGDVGVDDCPEIKEEIDVDEEFNATIDSVPHLEYDDVEIKSEIDVDEKEQNENEENINNKEKIVLSSSSESEDEDEIVAVNNENSKLLKIGFNWEVLNNNSLLSGVTFKNEEPSDDEDEESHSQRKKKRILTASEKREKAKSEEERLRLIEERLMDTERDPETADDFDRAVLGNPDSSALWLKYMAFHIQGTEIEKARSVARRALKAISFREEQEKLNIWIALLNLENIYGNEDSLNNTLNEALQSNDSYKIHLHMLNVHGQSTRFQEMERLGNFIMKKYKEIDGMWNDVGLAYFSVGKVESARNVLQKALTVVDKSLHIPIILKFAQLENKYGSPERAQTLFESILASFPKRVDIWSCYVDMLVKSNLIEMARQVLERATSQTLRPRKMKILFKKFLTFEEQFGTPGNVEKVREAAVEYVQTVGEM